MSIMSSHREENVDDPLCKAFARASLKFDADDLDGELIIKGKPRPQQGPVCRQETKEQLKVLLLQRKPIDLSIDSVTFDTPLHRFLKAPSKETRPGIEVEKQFNMLLSELAAKGCLHVFINMQNKQGQTPLSLCLLTESLIKLIVPLIAHGAQLHHLCGKLEDRCNHLHYAMQNCAPYAIHATLDQVSKGLPASAEVMYAINRNMETPKNTLRRRIQESEHCPELQQELGRILDKMRAYPPFGELFCTCNYASARPEPTTE